MKIVRARKDIGSTDYTDYTDAEEPRGAGLRPAQGSEVND